MPTKVRLVKSMVFPVDMYGCESWTVKKACVKLDTDAQEDRVYTCVKLDPDAQKDTERTHAHTSHVCQRPGSQRV